MKKKSLGLLTLLLSLSLAACSASGTSSKASEPVKSDSATSAESSESKAVATRYTVKFENNGERVATESVKEGETLAANQIPTVRAPEGQEFVGWADASNNIVDLTTFKVTADVTFKAVFKAAEQQGDVLSVEDVKKDGETYYLVLGWWEVNDPADPTKVTSHLTKQTVRLFYQNVIDYLKASGASDTDIGNIQFRDYSSATVAEMGAAINADGDVDLMIGVGNNINSTAGCTLYESSNDYKFQTPMGEGPTARYVACLSSASELGVATYKWLKNTDAGVASFVRELTEAEIKASLVPVSLDFKVTVHGDETKATTLVDKDSVVEMPTITVPEGKLFKGFALAADGEVKLEVAKDATLKYDNVKDLAAEGSKAIDLYPIFEDVPVVAEDLVVYVQINGTNLTLTEAKLLAARFNSTLENDENVKFNFVEGDAATFTAQIGNDSDVIIGGNNPLKNFGVDETGPLANAGAKHFANTSRKVIISDKVAQDHKELAKKLYDFIVAEAVEFEFHYTYWVKNDEWVTADERTAIDQGIQTRLNLYLGIGAEETLAGKYNVKVSSYVAQKTKVADLGAETKALRDGKCTDLIIGCGNNVDSTGTMDIVEKKALGAPFVAAASRYVALLNENPLAREVYESYFVTETIA